MSLPSSILEHHSTGFQLAFAEPFFFVRVNMINYDAVSNDGSLLSAWISFDGKGLVFN